jgi:hypothetical protein
LVLIGQQQQLLAGFGVSQADTAGIAWAVLGDDADCAELSKLFVREIEEWLKRLLWQADQLKRVHGGYGGSCDATMVAEISTVDSPLSDMTPPMVRSRALTIEITGDAAQWQRPVH